MLPQFIPAGYRRNVPIILRRGPTSVEQQSSQPFLCRVLFPGPPGLQCPTFPQSLEINSENIPIISGGDELKSESEDESSQQSWGMLRRTSSCSENISVMDFDNIRSPVKIEEISQDIPSSSSEGYSPEVVEISSSDSYNNAEPEVPLGRNCSTDSNGWIVLPTSETSIVIQRESSRNGSSTTSPITLESSSGSPPISTSGTSLSNESSPEVLTEGAEVQALMIKCDDGPHNGYIISDSPSRSSYYVKHHWKKILMQTFIRNHHYGRSTTATTRNGYRRRVTRRRVPRIDGPYDRDSPSPPTVTEVCVRQTPRRAAKNAHKRKSERCLRSNSNQDELSVLPEKGRKYL